ncbi:hypothetical protein [Paraburkholderia sp. MM6662-R1]|uniref:hypothetical protein n=1 Tax=Paraburkholderia sp. MM6662-R1 TaxID=2991066 RepID=UPI003D1F5AD6
MNEYTVDTARVGLGPTGIYVRATFDGKRGNYDIAELDRDSLHCWLRSRGGENLFAENVVLLLLGHPSEPRGAPVEDTHA